MKIWYFLVFLFLCVNLHGAPVNLKTVMFDSSKLTYPEDLTLRSGSLEISNNVSTSGLLRLYSGPGVAYTGHTVPDGHLKTNTLSWAMGILSAGQRIKVLSVSDQTAVLTNYTERSYLQLSHPHSFDGVGARLTNLVTDPFFGQAIFANAADKSTNYVEYRITVPEDVDTNQPVILDRLKFRLSNTDANGHRYVLSLAVQADSGGYAGTPGTEINVDFAGDASGAAGDVETVSSVTLTGWPGQLVAGRLWVIRLARDGDNTDSSTVDSFSGPLTLSYGKQ